MHTHLSHVIEEMRSEFRKMYTLSEVDDFTYNPFKGTILLMHNDRPIMEFNVVPIGHIMQNSDLFCWTWGNEDATDKERELSRQIYDNTRYFSSAFDRPCFVTTNTLTTDVLYKSLEVLNSKCFVNVGREGRPHYVALTTPTDQSFRNN